MPRRTYSSNSAIRAAAGLVAAATVLITGGCSTYEPGYDYEPEIHEATVSSDSTAISANVRTLASIVGVRRADEDAGLPRSVEVRLRIDNESDVGTVSIDPASLILSSANLDRLPRPIVEPADGVHVPPRGSRTLTAYFPLESRRFDLGALNLRWTLSADGDFFTQSATFSRRRYETRHHHPQFGVGVGVGYHDWD